jgi:replication factor C small subunit
MENYSANCRFILSCNYSSKIISPIQSRCAIFRFKLLEKKDVEKVMKRIANTEKLEIEEEAITSIYEGSEGDCRRSINLMQSTAAVSPKISKELVSTILSEAQPKDIRIILEYALSGDFEGAKNKLLDVMIKESISGQDIIKIIQKEIWNLTIEPEIKVKLTEKTGEAEFRIVEGSDPFIQLQSLIASFVLAGMGKQ